MTKTLLTALVLLYCTACNNRNRNNTTTASIFTVTTFKSEAGWGYAVVLKGKPFIRQPYIPALSGNTPFKKEEDALKVGNYVCSLIKAKRLPSVRSADLVKMGILPDSSTTSRLEDEIH